jgi:eukaryotic-like serine/threonine-protein kinase
MDGNPLLDRWEEVDALVNAALDRPPGERRAFLEGRCAGDPELLRLVTSVLDQEGRADRLLDADDRAAVFASASPSTAPAGADEDRAGERVGAWILERPIGRGGTGTVYLAERADGQFNQRVAVKLLRRGLDTDDILARFRAERQILASLDHPHIARLIGGGTTDDDRPYLVMELVEGEPITDHADRHRLTIEERLRLFVTVARAVQYAHRKLIVHRDIKPGNILVTGDGTVKLLDFGIAKLLDDPGTGDSTPRTRPGIRLMTPQYASPEQVRGEMVTTASDVYQLGVLLHLLLSGRLPYHQAGHSVREIERAITDREPPSPSASVTQAEPQGEGEGYDPAEVASLRRSDPERLRRRLRGDLDMIVGMAIRKEPERRYASVDDLASDVERHLTGHRVMARPDTLAYRARTFTRRRPGIVALAVAGVLAASGYVATLQVHASRLATERDRVRAEAERAEEVAGILVDIFNVWDPGAGGPQTSSRVLLRQAAARAERLEGQPELQAEAFGVLADVHGRLGIYDEALQYAERAAAIARTLHGDSSPEAAAAQVRAAGFHRSLGQHDRAGELYERALAVQRAALAPDDLELARSLEGLAAIHRLKGEYEAAEGLATEVLRIRRAALGAEHPEIASALNALAVIARHRGDHDRALPLYERSLEMRRRLLGPDHPEVALSLNNLAVFLRSRGEYAAAEPLYREALEIRRRIYGDEHPEVTTSLTGLGAFYFNTGNTAAAEEAFREALRLDRQIYGGEHPSIARNIGNLGSVYLSQERYEEAEAHYREALEMERRLHGEEHPEVAFRLSSLGGLMRRTGRLDEASALLARSLEISEAVYGRNHNEVAVALHALGHVARERGDDRQARAFWEEALDIRRERLSPTSLERAANLHDLGALLARQGQVDRARELLAEALEIREGVLDAGHPDIAETRGELARIGAVPRRRTAAAGG